MPDAISNTSPLLYLYRLQAIEWLPRLFSKVWAPTAVVEELKEGQRRGFDVPNLSLYSWCQTVGLFIVTEKFLALRVHWRISSAIWPRRQPSFA